MKFKSFLRLTQGLLLSIAALTFVNACDKYDDSSLRELIESQKKEIDGLKDKINELQDADKNVSSDIATLNSQIASLETGNYIKDVTALSDGSGYMITFAEGDAVIVKNGNDGESGKDGVTPQFKIADGNWMVSYDNGASWSEAGSATSGLVITDAAVDESNKKLTLTLADGTKIALPYNAAYLEIDKSSVTADKDGETIEVKVLANSTFTATSSASWATVTKTAEGVKIVVAANTTYNEPRTATVEFSCDGLTKSLIIQQAGQPALIFDLEKESESVTAAAGALTVKLNINTAFSISCDAWWVQTSQLSDGASLLYFQNTSGAARTAKVTFTCEYSTKTFTLTQAVGTPVTVLIKAGTFTMGSPTTETDRSSDETQHQVTLTQDFYMGKYEVTNAQFCEFLNDKCIGSDGKYTTADYGTQIIVATDDMSVKYSYGNWIPQSGYEDYPVVNVTWYGASEYAKWIGGTLPTEAQWEYACRAGSTTAYSFGDSSDSLGEYAWYDNNSDSKTHPVGQKKPNAWGLYDMHGNVWEWCADWYGDYPSNAVTDPTGPTTGSDRVLRGGSWSYFADYCRSASRLHRNPVYCIRNYGFRVCFPSSSSIE